MPILKRRRLHSDAAEATRLEIVAAVPTATRRATRLADAAASPAPPAVPQPSASDGNFPVSKRKRGRPPKSENSVANIAGSSAMVVLQGPGSVRTSLPHRDAENTISQRVAPRARKSTRYSNESSGTPEKPASVHQSSVDAPATPSFLIAPLTPRAASQNNIPCRPAPSAAGSQAVAPTPSESLPVPTPMVVTTPKQQQPPSHPHHSQQRLRPNAVPTPNKRGFHKDRNIDKVVLGNTCFSAWYPSYYGKDMFGLVSGSSAKSNGTGHQSDVKDIIESAKANGKKPSGKSGSARGKEDKAEKSKGQQPRREPMVDRLYVCPTCFKYSKELVSWWKHVELCPLKHKVPGQKIYVHPKGKNTAQIPAPPRPGRKKKGDPVDKFVPQPVEEGEWGIWEVDGEDEMLFCQNLSLFGKLFLDNKSVFFYVSSFNYYLLVYTPPPPPPQPPQPPPLPPPPPPPSIWNAKPSAAATEETPTATIAPPAPTPASPRIVGFFSKEKMSWDNNTLACILVFPPWQRKGLGAMLMGVSYEIARREGMLGGPEKPISDLGRKGYKRYWAGEIARWLLTLESAADGDEEAMVVDVQECSRAIWVALDDCLVTLRDMNIAEEAGMGPPRKRRAPSPGPDEDVGENVEDDGQATDQPEGDDYAQEHQQVRRVKISKARVRQWVTGNRIDLTRPCDPEGFIDRDRRWNKPSPDSTEDDEMTG